MCREVKRTYKGYYLKDTMKYYKNDTQTTWSNGNNSRRIDYIFTPQHILNNSFYSYFISDMKDFFQTDHKATILIIDNNYLDTRSIKEQNVRNVKTAETFGYHKIDKEIKLSNYVITNPR